VRVSVAAYSLKNLVIIACDPIRIQPRILKGGNLIYWLLLVFVYRGRQLRHCTSGWHFVALNWRGEICTMIGDSIGVCGASDTVERLTEMPIYMS